MRLLNIDLDDLYLRGRCVRSASGEGKFALNLGLKCASVHISNEVYFESSGGREWEGAVENSILFSNRYSFRGSTIVDVRKPFKRGYNILFTGVYSPDCSRLLADVEVGGTRKNFCGIAILACGLMYNAVGVMKPNMVIVIPSNCDYKIGGQVYSGLTGKARYVPSRFKLWKNTVQIFDDFTKGK